MSKTKNIIIGFRVTSNLFQVFLKPVDTEEVPDYCEVIEQPMDVSTMMKKIDQHLYCNVASFVGDINLICSNALEYNPEHRDEGEPPPFVCFLLDFKYQGSKF